MGNSAKFLFLVILCIILSAFAGPEPKPENAEFAMNFFLNDNEVSNSPKISERKPNTNTNGRRPPPVRFATFKPAPTRQSAKKSPQSTATDTTRQTYIDILKDRKVYEEVKRSRTNEVNSVWSSTFLAFFGLELFLIGSFITFGLLMFVLLQSKPKKSEKHVSLFS